MEIILTFMKGPNKIGVIGVLQFLHDLFYVSFSIRQFACLFGS